jgi:hypothetical protein
MSPTEVRASLLRASRRHEAAIFAGRDEEPSDEADAGAMLEAEQGEAVLAIRLMLEALGGG